MQNGKKLGGWHEGLPPNILYFTYTWYLFSLVSNNIIKWWTILKAWNWKRSTKSELRVLIWRTAASWGWNRHVSRDLTLGVFLVWRRTESGTKQSGNSNDRYSQFKCYLRVWTLNGRQVDFRVEKTRVLQKIHFSFAWLILMLFLSR